MRLRRERRQAEIHDGQEFVATPGIDDHEVSRFQIAVDDASRVSRLKGVAKATE